MNDREWPLVTVFTLVYNTGKYVVEALESVRANNYPNLQHIIIDDCSTDGVSVNIVEDWLVQNKYPCTFIKHPVNQGICKTLNEILAISDGKYTLGISDDLIVEDRIHHDVEIFESLPESVAVIFGDSKVINKNGDHVADSFIREIAKMDPEDIDTRNIFNLLLTRNFIPAMAATVRTAALKKINGYDENLSFEDHDMWLRLSRNNEFFFFNRTSALYRVHGENFHVKVKFWTRDMFYILVKHKDRNEVNLLLMKFIEPLYEAGDLKAARLADEIVVQSGLNPGIVSFFIKLKAPFFLYRPFKFFLKRIYG